jgi:hypothetical protein
LFAFALLFWRHNEWLLQVYSIGLDHGLPLLVNRMTVSHPASPSIILYTNTHFIPQLDLEATLTANDGALYTDLLRELKSNVFTARTIQALLAIEPSFAHAKGRQRWHHEYEAGAIMERWIINVAQDTVVDDLPAQLLAHEYARDKFVSELHEVLKMEASSAAKALAVVDEVRRQVQRDLDVLVAERATVQLRWDSHRGLNVSLGRDREWHVQIKVNKRVQAIVTRASKDVSPSEGLARASRVLLRYKAHLHTSAQHWGPIQPIFDHLVKHFNVRHEGFASPLNSRAILAQADCTFCTLYKDTDHVVGSLGSFFAQNLLMDEWNWTVHPPFTETLLTKTAAKVLSSLQQAHDQGRQLILGVGWCDWTDMQCFQDLVASGFKRMHQSLPKNGYHFERPDGSWKVATFVNHYFLFSALPLSEAQQAQVPELERLVNA